MTPAGLELQSLRSLTLIANINSLSRSPRFDCTGNRAKVPSLCPFHFRSTPQASVESTIRLMRRTEPWAHLCPSGNCPLFWPISFPPWYRPCPRWWRPEFCWEGWLLGSFPELTVLTRASLLDRFCPWKKLVSRDSTVSSLNRPGKKQWPAKATSTAFMVIVDRSTGEECTLPDPPGRVRLDPPAPFWS